MRTWRRRLMMNCGDKILTEQDFTNDDSLSYTESEQYYKWTLLTNKYFIAGENCSVISDQDLYYQLYSYSPNLKVVSKTYFKNGKTVIPVGTIFRVEWRGYFRKVYPLEAVKYNLVKGVIKIIR